MRKYIFVALLYAPYCFSQTHQLPLPVYNPDAPQVTKDWLLYPVSIKAEVYKSIDNKSIILSNGLLQRVFRLKPNMACTEFKNLVNGEQMIRAIKPEGRLYINDRVYNIGGLYGQKENAYLQTEWIDSMKSGSQDFMYDDYAIQPAQASLRWKPTTWTLNKQQATGIEIIFNYHSPLQELEGLHVQVHYVLYDGLPLISKSITVTNNGNKKIKLNRVVNEILATPEEESAVVGSVEQMKKPQGIYIESNYAFNNAMRYDISDQTTHWRIDSSYTSQVNYNFQTPCLLEVYVERGPGVELKLGDVFNSIKTYELLLDSYDRERRGLSIRKMYNTIVPWTTQNPIFMHLVSKNDEEVKTAVDQCANTGYEALILSFGSHCDIEDTSARNIAKWKSLADYAHRKNILIGGYSLFSSRRISDEDDVIDPVTGKPDAGAFFGHAPCYGSKWGLTYLAKIKFFFEKTGFNIFENDGPYPGDVCASTTHPGHHGLDDSQWKQMELQKSLYHWCNENGIYVNAPDWYFLDGTNKIALGYREVNFSLPREQQLVLNRQNIFDGTWEKTPSMSWGFVPLTKYQGGGPEAVLEPLNEHLKEYEALMMQYYGAGVQACYRGPRLYDTEKTKQLVIQVIKWYKEYREILNADIIHLRRADGRDWDGWMHVNPTLKTKGIMFLFNPSKNKIERKVDIPLYYTGLNDQAIVSEKASNPKVYKLNREYNIQLDFTIAPESFTWFTIEK
ncbi:MAG: alpha-galactosidase [Bacteroidetes bacterium]|nr:alpha-galactosidase [Bacteroidota bacterium]